MKVLVTVLAIVFVHLLPSLFLAPLFLPLRGQVETGSPRRSPMSMLVSLYGFYKWLKTPEVVESAPYVAYGPPITFWVAEGSKRAELRIPDPLPLHDEVGNFLLRHKLRRASKNPNKSWLSPGYGVISLAALTLYGLVSSFR